MAPLLWLAPAWLLGIFLQGWLSFQPQFLLAAAMASFCLATGLFFINLYYLRTGSPEKRFPPAVPLALAFLCLGALRYQISIPQYEPGQIGYWAGEPGSVPEVRVTGVVQGDPVYTGSGGSFRLDTRQIWPPGADGFQDVTGDILVKFKAGETYQPGDLLELAGKLRLPAAVAEDGFPYRDYLARQGMYAVIKEPVAVLLAAGQDFWLTHQLNQIQNAAIEISNRLVGGREAGLLNGILLGDQQGLDPGVKDSFRRTGSTHIIAISGANITIAAVAFLFVFRRFMRRRFAMIFSVAGIAAYVLLVGASPSVVRAGIMGGLGLLGVILGREYLALFGLLAASLLMTLADPRVFYDIGFELSAVATLGLILVARPLQELPFFKKWPTVAIDGLLVGFSAEIFTIPLSLFYFHQLSPVSLPTGLLGLPALPFIMGTGSLALVGGWLFGWLPVLAQAAAFPAKIFLVYLIGVEEFFASLPFALAKFDTIHPIWILCYYTALACVLGYWRSESFRNGTLALSRQKVTWVALLAGVAVIWLLVLLT